MHGDRIVTGAATHAHDDPLRRGARVSTDSGCAEDAPEGATCQHAPLVPTLTVDLLTVDLKDDGYRWRKGNGYRWRKVDGCVG